MFPRKTAAVPEEAPEVVPEPTPEVVPEPTPEVVPEPTPEVSPEPTPEVSPEPTPEAVPEPTPEAVPEPTPEPTPDAEPVWATAPELLPVVPTPEDDPDEVFSTFVPPHAPPRPEAAATAKADIARAAERVCFECKLVDILNLHGISAAIP
jgi:hypothetical protein